LSHKTNAVIQLLTIFSVTMLPLTFITGLYGMNVGLPFEQQPNAFWLVIGMMAIIFTGMLGYFAKKHWL
ncbi:MAG: CorA family divalent cation transporter, partial [Candidatus Peribacteraceae bacterium]|nr:CorA family divalent cation transporter [Candidatus Peribacteraceae bacterium]